MEKYRIRISKDVYRWGRRSDLKKAIWYIIVLLAFASPFIILLSGCATPQWQFIDAGQSKDSVENLVGSPDSYQTDIDGKSVSIYHPNAYSSCEVTYSKENLVENVDCDTDTAAQERARKRSIAAMGMYLQNQPMHSTPTFVPVQPYQVPIQRQTHCTTNVIGNSGYTDCSTY